MGSKGFKPAGIVTILLLLLRDTLAVAPGDEYDGCEVPDYPVNIKVLMDSWRYHTLLAQNDATNTGTTAVWTTEGSGGNAWYSTGGACKDSSVAVCPGESGNTVLFTQNINKSLPAPDEYPVRVFVKLNVTYPFLNCSEERECDGDLELQFRKYTDSNQIFFIQSDISPEKRTLIRDTIQYHYHFDLSVEVDVFSLTLINREGDACVNVSRVLVYRYECPGHEKLSTGLERRPATQAPVSGTVSAMPYCVENSHHSDMNGLASLLCTAEGEWMNDGAQCVCDFEYYKVGPMCKDATFMPVRETYTVNEIRGTVQVCFTSDSGVRSVKIFTQDDTARATFDYLPINQRVSFESPQPQCVSIQIFNDEETEGDERFMVVLMKDGVTLSSADVIISDNKYTVMRSTFATQHMMPTPVISASITPVSTDVTDRESSTAGSGVSAAVYAGVGGMVVVIIALILIVILLIVVLLKKTRKHRIKDSNLKTNTDQLSNPAYDATTQGNTKNSSNGSSNTHRPVLESSSGQLSNPLYSVPRTVDLRSNGVQHSNITHYEEPQSNEYFEEPQYSIPIDSMVPATQYETPVITSPSGAKEPTQPPPVYDYAATVPQSTAPEYAVLEPQTHTYHFLESPDPHTATPAGDRASGMSETGTGGHQDEASPSQINEYSVLEQN